MGKGTLSVFADLDGTRAVPRASEWLPDLLAFDVEVGSASATPGIELGCAGLQVVEARIESCEFICLVLLATGDLGRRDEFCEVCGTLP